MRREEGGGEGGGGRGAGDKEGNRKGRASIGGYCLSQAQGFLCVHKQKQILPGRKRGGGARRRREEKYK